MQAGPGCKAECGVLEVAPVLGALCAPKATLRLNEQVVREGEHDKKIVKTFSLKLIESC